MVERLIKVVLDVLDAVTNPGVVSHSLRTMIFHGVMAGIRQRVENVVVVTDSRATDPLVTKDGSTTDLTRKIASLITEWEMATGRRINILDLAPEKEDVSSSILVESILCPSCGCMPQILRIDRGGNYGVNAHTFARKCGTFGCILYRLVEELRLPRWFLIKH